LVKLAIDKLSRQYPAPSYALNHELSQLLVFLEAPDVVEKTLGLLMSSADPAEQVWFACVLREAKGWSPQQRETYFAWFNTARAYKGGNSFAKFILRIREQAIAKLTESERIALATLLAVPTDPPKVTTTGPARSFVKAWTVAELDQELPTLTGERNFVRGKELFGSLQCLTCHRFGNEGGSIGPDITAVGNRFNRHDLLESIIEPSKVISDQYATLIVTSKSGETFMGPVADDNNMALVLVVDAVGGGKKAIDKNNIKSREVSKMSLMPPGLMNVLNKDEILDLLVYIESGGNAAAKQYRGAK
jgi:putative heme-binding domain-containing protein